jgi:hypothetical protein
VLRAVDDEVLTQLVGPSNSEEPGSRDPAPPERAKLCAPSTGAENSVVTLVKFEPDEACPRFFAEAHYLAHRLDDAYPWIDSLIEGWTPFESFVDHHPDLLRLFQSLIPGARAGDE